LRLAGAGGAGEHLAARPAHVLRVLPRRAPPGRDLLRVALVRPRRRLRGVLLAGRAALAPRAATGRRPAGAARPALGCGGYADRARAVRGRRGAAGHHGVRLVLRLAVVGGPGAGELVEP